MNAVLESCHPWLARSGCIRVQKWSRPVASIHAATNPPSAICRPHGQSKTSGDFPGPNQSRMPVNFFPDVGHAVDKPLQRRFYRPVLPWLAGVVNDTDVLQRSRSLPWMTPANWSTPAAARECLIGLAVPALLGALSGILDLAGQHDQPESNSCRPSGCSRGRVQAGMGVRECRSLTRSSHASSRMSCIRHASFQRSGNGMRLNSRCFSSFSSGLANSDTSRGSTRTGP